MESHYYLRCLGQPVLLTPAGEPVRFRVKKHLALLVYLATQPKIAHRRDHLADLLWSTAPVAEGRHSLATALSVLRPRLGRKAFDTTRDTVRLVGTGIKLDLERLEAGDILGDEVTPALQVAGFLDGFEVQDAEEFHWWKDRQQAHWLPKICDALVRLIDKCRRTADSRQMEQLADRMLVLDPLSEHGIRAKMEARAFAGDRLTALRVFEEWKAELAQELGAVPSEMVDGIATRLRRRGWERETTSNVPAVRTDQWRDRPFIGRSLEYQMLYEGWERTKRGEPGHMLVRGESGIGKTTLVDRLSTAAALEGASISRVQCYELERDIPYAAVTGLVLDLMDRSGATGTPPEALGELARTVPEIRQRWPTVPSAVDTDGETARLRLAEALGQLTFAVAEEHPAVLVVDDLHLADDASLAVLHLLIRRAKARHVMVVLTVRPWGQPAPVQALRLLDAGRSLGLRTVDLHPLVYPESDELLDSLTTVEDGRPTGAARRAILDAAAGNPMVLELLIRDWQSYGNQSLALCVGAMTPDFAPRRHDGAPYDQIFERMTGALDPTTQNVLKLAAILGHRLNDPSMYALVDLGIGQTMTGLAQLTNVRVLRDMGQGLEFVNELIRACAYQAVPSPLRRTLHSSVADRLIAIRTEQQSGSQDLEVAWHCIRAGRPSEAAPYLLEGCREAIQRGAPYEAERALHSACSHLDVIQRAQAHVLWAEALQEQGRWRDSLSLLNEIDVTDQGIADSADVLRLYAQTRLNDVRETELRKGILQVLAIMKRTRAPRVAIKASRLAASFVNDLRDADLASTVLREVESIAAISLGGTDKIEWAITKAQLFYALGQSEACSRQIQETFREVLSAGIASSTLARTLQGIGVTMLTQGQYSAAVEPLTRAYQVASQLGADEIVRSCAANIALSYCRTGNIRQQLKWAEISLAGTSESYTGYRQILSTYCKAMAHVQLGAAGEATATLEAQERSVSDDAPEWMIQAWRLYKADVLQAMGKSAEARACARRALGYPEPQLYSTPLAGPFARWLPLVAETDLERAAARELIASLAKDIENHDALDQAEILAGLIMMEDGCGRDSGNYLEQLRNRLLNLPEAIPAYLHRLGALPLALTSTVVAHVTKEANSDGPVDDATTKRF